MVFLGCSKKEDGSIDFNNARTGEDLINFVDNELFPYLAKFKEETDSPRTIQYKIGEIFSEIKNKVNSGYNLREILEAADSLSFNSLEEKDELIRSMNQKFLIWVMQEEMEDNFIPLVH